MGQVRDDRFKIRAVVLGAFFVVLVSVWATYSEFIVRASRLNMSNFALALFVPFVLCALIVNPVLKAQKPEWAFGRSDLLVALTMGLASAVIPAADGLPGYLLGISCGTILFCYTGEWVGALLAQSYQTVDGTLGRRAGDDMVF